MTQGDAHCSSPLNSRLSGKLSEIFHLVGKFAFNDAKLGLKTAFLGKYGRNVIIQSTHIFLYCRKFAAVFWKIAIFCSSTSITHDAADCRLLFLDHVTRHIFTTYCRISLIRRAVSSVKDYTVSPKN